MGHGNLEPLCRRRQRQPTASWSRQRQQAVAQIGAGGYGASHLSGMRTLVAFFHQPGSDELQHIQYGCVQFTLLGQYLCNSLPLCQMSFRRRARAVGGPTRTSRGFRGNLNDRRRRFDEGGQRGLRSAWAVASHPWAWRHSQASKNGAGGWHSAGELMVRTGKIRVARGRCNTRSDWSKPHSPFSTNGRAVWSPGSFYEIA